MHLESRLNDTFLGLVSGDVAPKKIEFLPAWGYGPTARPLLHADGPFRAWENRIPKTLEVGSVLLATLTRPLRSYQSHQADFLLVLQALTTH